MIAVIVRGAVSGGVDLVGEDGFRLAAIGAGLVLTTSTRRPVHVVVTVLAMLSLATYIALYTLRLA